MARKRHQAVERRVAVASKKVQEEDLISVPSEEALENPSSTRPCPRIEENQVIRRHILGFEFCVAASHEAVDPKRREAILQRDPYRHLPAGTALLALVDSALYRVHREDEGLLSAGLGLSTVLKLIARCADRRRIGHSRGRVRIRSPRREQKIECTAARLGRAAVLCPLRGVVFCRCAVVGADGGGGRRRLSRWRSWGGVAAGVVFSREESRPLVSRAGVEEALVCVEYLKVDDPWHDEPDRDPRDE
mmetsp:Transcript_28370/g.69114  ORF Transcript_28370/g.69114 Transcript_28370/m.69114 type:complete len:247 (-) Transcript_28370:214-954(-)